MLIEIICDDANHKLLLNREEALMLINQLSTGLLNLEERF